MPRQLISSNTPGERLASFSRAVRVGGMVFVSGTTASDQSGITQHPGDAAAQTSYVLRKIEAALAEAGASIADVVRTRIFVRHIEDLKGGRPGPRRRLRGDTPGQHAAAR